jgi:uncharacterized protein YcbK (DUF882 family)
LVKTTAETIRLLSGRGARAAATLGLALAMLTIGVNGTQSVVANGDTRTLSFYHTHTKERTTVTFKRNGRYDPAGLKQLNHFLRDWRNNKQTNMDPRLFDVVWEVYKDANASREVHIISAYRSAETNEGLRSRTSGVARNSQHTLGRAMDIHVPGINMAKIREAGLRLQRGGVGFYPTSGLPFVHLDVGNVRHWPRMTRDQLARVFPDGRTVHLPSDGKPMKNYQLALADVRRHGGSVRGEAPGKQEPIMMASASAGSSGGNFISRLLSGGDEDEETTPASAPAAAAARAPATTPAQPVATRAPAPAPSAAVAIAQAVPLPAARPALGFAPEPDLATQTAWMRPQNARDQIAELATSTTPAAAPAMPVPRPSAAPAPAQMLAAATPAAPVPTPELRPSPAAIPIAPPVTAATASLGMPSDAAAKLLASAMKRLASSQTEAPAPVAATRLAAAPQNGRAATTTTAVSPQRSARETVVLEHPDVAGVDKLIAAPTAVVPSSFGANPTAGLRSDAFAGASIASVRTERFASRAPRAARIVDVNGG